MHMIDTRIGSRDLHRVSAKASREGKSSPPGSKVPGVRQDYPVSGTSGAAALQAVGCIH